METIEFPVITGTVTTAESVIWPIDGAKADNVGTNLEEYDEISIGIVNAGGGSGDSTSAVSIQVSPDNETAHFKELTDLGVIASGGVKTYTISDNAYKYLRVTATCGASDTTSESYVIAKRKV